MKIEYARVATTGQNLDMQLDSLRKAACEKIFMEKESGVKERTVLNELLTYIRQGDELIVYKLNRFGRSLKDLLNIVDDLQTRQINLVSLNDIIDAKTPSGKLMMQFFAILAENESGRTAKSQNHVSKQLTGLLLPNCFKVVGTL